LSLRLYNTANRKKEDFHPLDEGKVGIYACGVTVYDLCHIGHARSAIVFDVLTRYLRARGFEVTYVRNFTDVDDKIIERANLLGKETTALAREFIDAFYDDMDRLGVLRADKEPRATDHIEGMIHMIKVLLEREYAYVEGTDVFFSVKDFREYGKLSGRKLDDMQAGSRIAVDEKKRHPMDFVLWKGVKPGEPQWSSPWGPGRPGWHLECSVMSNHYLGPSFDIHGGGRDLLFPHHENERAQSLGANGGSFARYWVHNGFVTVESEKMSKSLGNFLTIRDALETYHPEVLRLFLISKHYRSPLDFSRDSVLALQSGLVRIYRTLRRVEDLVGPPGEDFTGTRESMPDHTPEWARPPGDGSLKSSPAGRPTSPPGPDGGTPGEEEPGHDQFLKQFIKTMDDDLNTAGAMGLVFDKVREMNKLMDSGDAADDEAALRHLAAGRHELLLAGRVLGLLQEVPGEFFRELSGTETSIDPAEIEKMIRERAAAKAEKDWSKADGIRERLKGMGIVLEDTPGGTTWRLDV